jgi:hypothetical protein
MSAIKIVLIAVALVVVAGWSAPVSAHVQASNDGVSAVMHILPEDDPTAAEVTYIQFTFGGSSRTFDVAGCACELVVRSGGREVSATPVEPIDATSPAGHVVVTFPREGIYDLDLRGFTDKSAKARFNLKYVVRVSAAGGAENAAGAVDVILTSLASLAAIGVLAYYNISGGTRYTTPKAPK